MTTATDHRHRARSVVRRPPGRTANQPVDGREPGGGLHPGGLERRGVVELGQQPGEAFGQHRLARARRADHEEVMSAGCGDLDREAGELMTADVGEIGHRRGLRSDRFVGGTGPGRLSGERVDQFANVRRAPHVAMRHERCLGVRPRRNHHLRIGARVDQRERPRDMAQRAVETEFTDERPTGHDLGRKLFAGDEHSDGDGQVESRADLADGGGSEIHRGASIGPLEPGGEQRGAHTIASLATRRIGQADDGEAGQPVGDMDLDGDRHSVDPRQRGRRDGGEHRFSA
jgi:hypothetical protein